jgi:neurofibromin 1
VRVADEASKADPRYDSLIPRMTSVLSTTTTLPILESVSILLETALRDPNYTFPQTALHGESSSSLPHSHSAQFGANNGGGPGLGSGSGSGFGRGHDKSYSASISSMPSLGVGSREQVLEDLGMRGLGELSFGAMKPER